MDFLGRIPFVELLGMKLERVGGGEAEITRELKEELTNSWSVAHGGVTMALLDGVPAGQFAGATPTLIAACRPEADR